jgi:hypothetical protein
LDRELADLPPELSWREWMLRVEAVIFAAAEPVGRETLARVVGKDCSIDLLIDDLRAELQDRPYEIFFVAGGWQHRTRSRFAVSVRASQASTRSAAPALSDFEAIVLMAIAYSSRSPGRPVEDLRQGGQPRHDRQPAQSRLRRLRATQPDAGRALYLRHDAALPVSVRHGDITRSA